MAGSPFRISDDSGGIVLGWITRIAVFIGVAGLGLFDAISIGSTAATAFSSNTLGTLSLSWETLPVMRRPLAGVVGRGNREI